MKSIKGCIAAVTVSFVISATAGAGQSVWDTPTPPLPGPTEITVYRSPTCGCCAKWLEHMKKHGFVIKDIQEADMDAVKRKLGVPADLQSCHTGVVAGYVIEGHVPAGDVKKLLSTKPALAGLAVPGMPVGAPGMEMGERKDAFAVMGFAKDGKASVFSEYNGH
jgi:hypothetical protein